MSKQAIADPQAKALAKDLAEYMKAEGVGVEEVSVRAGVKHMTAYRACHGIPISDPMEFMIRTRLGLKR